MSFGDENKDIHNEQILIGFLNFIEGGLMMVMYVFLNFKGGGGGGLVMAIDKYI